VSSLSFRWHFNDRKVGVDHTLVVLITNRMSNTRHRGGGGSRSPKNRLNTLLHCDVLWPTWLFSGHFCVQVLFFRLFSPLQSQFTRAKSVKIITTIPYYRLLFLLLLLRCCCCFCCSYISHTNKIWRQREWNLLCNHFTHMRTYIYACFYFVLCFYFGFRFFLNYVWIKYRSLTRAFSTTRGIVETCSLGSARV